LKKKIGQAQNLEIDIYLYEFLEIQLCDVMQNDEMIDHMIMEQKHDHEIIVVIQKDN